MYRIIEHTADVGLEILCRDMSCLFSDAAQGLQAIIFNGDPLINLTGLKSGDKIILTVEMKAENPEELLVKWLREILYHLQEKNLVLVEAQVINLFLRHKLLLIGQLLEIVISAKQPLIL